jgi:AcrR family transcriptional regulator
MQSEARRDGRGAQTRELLLCTGERLFAAQGIARTSTRQITAEAGVSRDAIHYHFGSKAALVLAIVESRTSELSGHLEQLFTRKIPDRGATFRDIAHAMVVAAAEMAEHDTGQYYHPFLTALTNDPEFRHLANSRSTPQSDTVVALLTPLTPGLSEDERVFRVASAMVLVLFGTGTGGITEWVASQVGTTKGRLLTMLTDTVTNVLAGGLPTGHQPHGAATGD